MKLLQVATVAAHRLSIVIALASVTAIGSSTIFAPSSQALTATTKFVCGKADGKPATVATDQKRRCHALDLEF